jgi:hypothetical protein
MADKPPKKTDPYWLSASFEKGMTTLACSNRRFWGRIGYAVDRDCLALAPAKLALQAAAAIARETGNGPESVLIVLQRLHTWMDDGKVSLAQIKEVATLFDDAYEAGVPSEEAAVAELKPILSKRLKSEAVVAATEDYGKNSNFAHTAKLIEKANSIGDTNTSVGTMLGSGSYEEIEKLKHLEKLSTGILELDMTIGGGLRRGCLGIFVGGPGDGKSMALSHIAAWALRCGLFVVYATLELSGADVLARVKANLTAVPINAVLDDPHRLKPFLSGMPLGPFIVNEFTPLATTTYDLEAWVADCEGRVGRKVDVMVTDYGDKLGVAKMNGKDDTGYKSGQVIFERMRIYAHERNLWHWTAAQATRQTKKGAKTNNRLDLNDIADSMHKARVADLVVTLNYNEEDESMLFHVAKNRHGKGKASAGPLPTDFEIGRIAPILETDEVSGMDLALAQDGAGRLMETGP